MDFVNRWRAGYERAIDEKVEAKQADAGLSQMSSEQSWSFWIDVGGTFTDCLAKSPAGEPHCVKVLSSGVVKGAVEETRSARLFSDSSQHGLADQFWRGTEIRFLSPTGDMLASANVVHFDSESGQFEMDQDVNQIVKGMRYELAAGLSAPILAIHLVQRKPIDLPLEKCQVDMGTTWGTNALLTRQGSRVALVASKGFRDFLHIGDQARPHLFELTIRKPEPLFESAIEIEERVLHDGTIEAVPDESTVRQQLLDLKQAGIESVAICFMFGYRYPEHEQMVAEIAKEVGFASVRCSSSVAPTIKLIPRGETTVLDAYLDLVVSDYLDGIQAGLPTGSQIRLMTSSGSLVSRSRFSAKDSVLSGPAGGVVGAVRVAEQAGFSRVIGFDMGGTSTDVSRSEGAFQRTYETYKAGVRIMTPMLDIETVAAGGGSICWFDGAKLRVGPDSVGADPGPACYGRGGRLSITDINLFLGRVQQDKFPFPLDLQAVHTRLDEWNRKMCDAGYEYTLPELAQGFLEIANSHMANAIHSISIARGYDPQDDVMVSFGGAGSQHCCAVAGRLQITKILDHPQSSMLSAVGIQLSDQSIHLMRSVESPYRSGLVESLEDEFEELEREGSSLFEQEGNVLGAKSFSRSLDMRYVGTAANLTIAEPGDGDYQAAFQDLHQQQFGYLLTRELEVSAMRVEVSIKSERLPKLGRSSKIRHRQTNHKQAIYSVGQKLEAELFDRSELGAGDQIVGPAIVADRHSTVVVDFGWQANVLPEGMMLIEKLKMGTAEQPSRAACSHEPADPILLEIYNSHFSSIARQMGLSLQRTSVSVNVKERLDFSCAIFTNQADLVVNAPHIPVHLGAMSETVRTIMKLNPNVVAGDVFVTNDPYAGGSHLPDITVVTPVFDPSGSGDLWFWVASRSHHAEIGGIAPGSMPAAANCLGEEGVLIQNFRLVAGTHGRIDEQEPTSIEHFAQLRSMLCEGPYPSRSPEENMADIAAQVAANQTGVRQLLDLVDRNSFPVVNAYMAHIQSAAERKTRLAIERLPDGCFEFQDTMDSGAVIRVAIIKQKDQLSIDFSGTDPVQADNLNANRAIVSSAVMYVMRLLIDEQIPLNQGVMKPVSIVLPECFLNPQAADNPLDSPAVVGGNVETSQRIVDVLLGALGLAAASQGTMNNWLMGDAEFGYYETVGGGSGATADSDGVDAIHTHMTNTRLTDPEILESRYPVILREFSIRRGSGGAGRYRGGDGLVRELEFRKPLTVSLLTSRRCTQPYGLRGGEPGAAGINLLKRLNQAGIELPSQFEVEVDRGDRLRIETPGGGGWGESC